MTLRKPTCLTIGNFDGVHLGHQSLLGLAAKIASEKNLDFQIVTFWPHPREVLRGKACHLPLASRAERIRLLKAAGASVVREIPFTPVLASLTAEQFVEDYLLPLGIRELAIGHDFTLGRQREGDAPLLEKIGSKFGFGVTQAAAFEVDGAPVSSTRLRECLSRGDVNSASKMLGRKYALAGKIAHGAGRGAGLGFPTANLGPVCELVPANGVYATHASIGGKKYRAVTNIGCNPTFGGTARTIESFLLACNGDLYGSDLRLEFVERLRGEQKFDSPASLARQIQLDIARAESLPSFNDLSQSSSFED